MLTPISAAHDYPIWEFTYSLPSYLNEYLFSDDSWVSGDGIPLQRLHHGSGRLTVRPGMDALHTFVFALINELQPQIIDSIWSDGPFKNAIHGLWPDGVGLTGSGQLVKDSPGYHMPVHVDNRNSFAAIILNLTDNHDGTKMFLDGDHIHTGPTRAGTGCVMLNTHRSMHSITNTSNRYRYAALMNLKLNMDHTHRFSE